MALTVQKPTGNVGRNGRGLHGKDKWNMFTVFSIMIVGMVVGRLFRRHVGWVKTLLMPLVCLLLFLLGLEMGSSDRIISAWRTIGLDAAVIATGSVLGSIVASWLLWKHVGGRDCAVDGGSEENITGVGQ